MSGLKLNLGCSVSGVWTQTPHTQPILSSSWPQAGTALCVWTDPGPTSILSSGEAWAVLVPHPAIHHTPGHGLLTGTAGSSPKINSGETREAERMWIPGTHLAGVTRDVWVLQGVAERPEGAVGVVGGREAFGFCSSHDAMIALGQ